MWFPSNIWENFATISKLQTPLNDTFPRTINRYTEIAPEKNSKFHGDKAIVPEDENIYDITTAQGEQKIRIAISKWPVDYKKQKAVCGENFCLFLFTDTDEKNKYCGEITNETQIVFLNLEQKFTSRSYDNPLNRTNGGRFGLKEGYGIDDIVSFEMIPTEFAEYERKRQPDDSYKNVPTGKNFIDYELRLYAKDGEIVNEYCDWYYMHKPIKTVE